MNKQTKIISAAVATAAALTIAGCTSHGTSKAAQPYNDAKMAKQQVRPTWTSIAAPDGFSNQATACLKMPDGTDPHIRMFAMFHKNGAYGAVQDVPDQTC